MTDHSLTLEQFIALNDEMAAIARVGVPLEIGLRGLGGELPGQLGQVTETLQQKLAAGQSLATAIAEPANVFPPAYQAIVLAGLKSGRLTVALEGVATSARRVAEVNRSIRAALFYPLLVMVLAYLVFVIFTIQWVPTLVNFYEQTSLSSLPIFPVMLAVSRTAMWWAPGLPLVVVFPLSMWYYSTLRSTRHPRNSMRHAAQVATFTELLAAMVAHEVPLDEAVTLAARATGNQDIQAECRQWAAQLRRGEMISVDARTRRAIPTWLAWLLQHAGSSSELTRNLLQAAHTYRREVARRARWFSRTFPILVTIAVGGAATLLTACLVLGPWFYVLYHLRYPGGVLV